MNNSLSDHFMDGFDMLNGNTGISVSGAGMYGGNNEDEADFVPVKDDDGSNTLGGDYESIF
jgi:hypothetical protein